IPARPGPLSPTRTVRIAIFLVSAATAAGVVGSAFFLLPKGLDVHTDIVGYPTFYDFNIERYLWAYAAIAGAFPLVAILLYLFFRRTIAPGAAQPLGVLELLDRRAPTAEDHATRTATSTGRVL